MSTTDILLLGMEKQNVLSINKSTAFFIYLLIFISALNLGAYWAGNWKCFPPIWKSSNTVFTNSYSGYVVYKQKYLLRLWWVWIFCDIVISCEIMLTQILKYVKETTWYQRCISMYLSLSALGKKNTMYFVWQGIDGITYSPQKRKVLNELKFVVLRKIFRKWLELFKTQLKTFIRIFTSEVKQQMAVLKTHRALNCVGCRS